MNTTGRLITKKRISFFLFWVLMTVTAFAQTENVALHKPVSVSSEAKGFPGANIVDGKISRVSKWEAANGKAPHIAEVDLRKYYNLTEIRIYTGIKDEEKKPDEMNQAAGFWSAKNFKLQYWDDANWSDMPGSEVHENRLTAVVFKYAPAITTYKIRLVCDDGEPDNIMEFEAFGTAAANMPSPPAASPSVLPPTPSTAPKAATITVFNKIVGKTMKYVGYNQGYYMPGSNASGWVEYSGVNGFRVWASLNAFVPETLVQVDKSLSSVQEFDNRKNELRNNPENNRYIKWKDILPLYDTPDSSSTNAMVFSYALGELKRLGVDVILQISSTDFEEAWASKWKQWQRYYALAYYAAKQGDVTMFALMNEPNHRNAGPMKLEQWIMAMQVVSDAIHCAVEDVNKQYKKALVPKFVGPVTAGYNPEWWAAVAKAIRTDYHGRKVDKDLLQIFSTHSYNSPAMGYDTRLQNIQKIIKANHPEGDTLPIVYTEIGRWMNAYLIDKEETMDSPSLFTEWAGIYGANMKNGGYGMFAFKFANTASGPYPEGIKSGHHFVWHGRRIVEDAYKNLAAGKPVTTSNAKSATAFITDGNKSDGSAWVSDSSSTEKWAIIDLRATMNIGSAVVYTGAGSGVYTAPDRVKSFKLQYLSGTDWKDIPGTEEKDNKYAQLFMMFKSPVQTNKLRFISSDKGVLKIREIKVFAANDGPAEKPDFNVSGIQRTGEVVRLFSKGFRNEHPLLQTVASVNDAGLDSYTSYDPASGNYYMWLVQRGMFDYNFVINLKELNIPANAAITAETVNANYYGEVSTLLAADSKGSLSFTLAPQSVVLLTISAKAVVKKTLTASDDATVQIGKAASAADASAKKLAVALDAATPSQNKVAYIRFNLSTLKPETAQRVLVQLTGYTDKTSAPYRLHVYAIPSTAWKEEGLAWNSAPLLDAKEALLHEVGTKAFVAGEIAFTTKLQNHYLDVTDIVKKYPASDYTFVVVRETRQLGDDEDKGRQVFISSSESSNGPTLIFYNTNQ